MEIGIILYVLNIYINWLYKKIDQRKFRRIEKTEIRFKLLS